MSVSLVEYPKSFLRNPQLFLLPGPRIKLARRLFSVFQLNPNSVVRRILDLGLNAEEPF